MYELRKVEQAAIQYRRLKAARERLKKTIRMASAERYSKTEIAKAAGISRASVYRLLDEEPRR